MSIELRDVIRQIAKELAAARSSETAVSPPASSVAGSRGATALFVERVEIEMPAYVGVSGSKVVLEGTPVNRTFAKMNRIGRISMTLVPTTEDSETQ